MQSKAVGEKSRYCIWRIVSCRARLWARRAGIVLLLLFIRPKGSLKVYIRNPSVPPYHSAATSRGDHISSHIEKKHVEKKH